MLIKNEFPIPKSIVMPCLSTKWKSKVNRPHYSVLNTEDTEKDFDFQITYWAERLKSELEKF